MPGSLSVLLGAAALTGILFGLQAARSIVVPGGRIGLLRLPPAEVLRGETEGNRSVDPARLATEGAGFRWSSSPEPLELRWFDVFVRPDDSAGE